MRIGAGARRFLGIVSLVSAAGACSSRRVFLYTPEARAASSPAFDGGVAVLELRDERGKHPLDHNLKLLALIPLVPFAVSHRDYPERTHLDDSENLNGFIPTVDLANAFASELEAAHVFTRARFVEGSLHAERYELRGQLFDCHVAEGYLTYGISFFSVVLHAVGFPEGTLRCGIHMRVELYDRRGGNVVWTKDLESASTRVTWIYDSAEADHACEMFGNLAREMFPPAVSELRDSAHSPDAR